MQRPFIFALAAFFLIWHFAYVLLVAFVVDFFHLLAQMSGAGGLVSLLLGIDSSLGIALLLGTAGLPHVLMRFYTAPTDKERARRRDGGAFAHRLRRREGGRARAGSGTDH